VHVILSNARSALVRVKSALCWAARLRLYQNVLVMTAEWHLEHSGWSREWAPEDNGSSDAE
jgi:hypothetical protein